MQTFIIHGGKPLDGSVRLGGAKNASSKLMIAALLSTYESRLLNFSHIAEIDIVQNIIEDLGGRTKEIGERTLLISPKHIQQVQVPFKYGSLCRIATMFIGPLLARFGKAIVPFPGGDSIGKRPIQWHLDGLRAMGAVITQKKDKIEAECSLPLKGCRYFFEKNTHTGTELLLMTAVLAKGKTILENAALEPEVDDLIEFLVSMGARIQRKKPRVIEIEGVSQLGPGMHKIMPDRNEAVSYACAAIATQGNIIVENANPQHLTAFLEKLDEMNAGYEIGNYGIRFFYKEPLKPVDVETKPHPDFMTDWQPLWAVLLTQIQGKSKIYETVSENRFQYVENLKKMGANISFFNPSIQDPSIYYNFQYREQDNFFHACEITGKTALKSGQFEVSDLRAGATLVLAGLVAKGTTVLNNIDLVDRGYEKFDSRLRSMGAEIVRISSDQSMIYT